MFHVLLGLPLLIIIAIMAVLLLFAITIAVVSIVGGTSVALLIKNKTLRSLLFIGCGILMLTALVCAYPFIAILVGAIALSFFHAGIIAFSMAFLLSILGAKLSASIVNKAGRAVSIMVFIISCCASAILAIVFGILSAIY